jgi:hypothetical protein
MPTGRKFNKKPVTRPRKSGAVRRRRELVQRRRLLALGMSEEKVAKLNASEIRELLKRPKRVAG